MLNLLQLLLPEVAAHHRLAVPVDDICEVLKGHADHSAFLSLQVARRQNPMPPKPLLVKRKHRSRPELFGKGSAVVVRGTPNIIKQHLVSSQ